MGMRSVLVGIADLVQRAELDAAQGAGGPEVAHDPHARRLQWRVDPHLTVGDLPQPVKAQVAHPRRIGMLGQLVGRTA